MVGNMEMKKGYNTVYEIIAAYRQATLHILNVSKYLMRKTIYILTFLIFNLKTFGQNQSNPWPKHYIPKNLNECLIQLDNILSDSLKNEIIN